MYGGGGIVEFATAAAQGGGQLGAAYFLFRAVAFLCTFIADRLDKRAARLAEQEVRLNARYDARMRALERSNEALTQLTGDLKRDVAELACELFKHDPGHVIFKRLGLELNTAFPVQALDTPGDMITKLGEMP